jgi:hypothetical protein
MSEGAEHEESQRRFGGLQRLYGMAGAERIRQAHVVVVGIGGVGSWAAEALARSGVARLTLVDMDHIAESNINRQIHALTSTTGQAKVEAMRERIALIHPGCRVDAVDDFVSPENWPALLPAMPDAVIDACDQVKAKRPWPFGLCAIRSGSSRWVPPAENAWRIKSMWPTCPESRTTLCWPSCVTACANTTALPKATSA